MLKAACDCVGSAVIALLIVAGTAIGATTSIASAQDPVPGRGAPRLTPGATAPNSGDFALASKAFADSTRIPDRFTVEGEDLSPPLAWSGAPADTRSFALICEDIDLRGKPFIHWVIYGIPANATELPEGLPKERELTTPIVAKQGTCSFPKDNVGYRGPATPRGDKPHRYRFTLYALKAVPEVKPGLTAETLRARMKDLILAEATLTGTYSRARKAGETPPGEQAREVVPGAPNAPAAPPGSPPRSPGAPPQAPPKSP